MTFKLTKMFSALVMLFLLLVLEDAECGSVFMYLPVGAKSHKNVWFPLAKALAEKA